MVGSPDQGVQLIGIRKFLLLFAWEIDRFFLRQKGVRKLTLNSFWSIIFLKGQWIVVKYM